MFTVSKPWMLNKIGKFSMKILDFRLHWLRLFSSLIFTRKMPTFTLQGTSLSQDTRFSDKEKKLMKQMKFADILSKKVDMSKVKLDVLRPWISSKITQLLKLEDDVIEEYVVNQLEEEKYPNAKKMQ